MDMNDFLKSLIEQNDRNISKKENKLQKEIDQVYKKAIATATKKFEKMKKMHPDSKASSEEVQKVINETIEAFWKEWEKLIIPIQKETLGCYDDGVEETSLLLAAGEKEEK